MRMVLWLDEFRKIPGLECFSDELPSADFHVLVDFGDLFLDDTHIGKFERHSVKSLLGQRLLILVGADQ